MIKPPGNLARHSLGLVLLAGVLTLTLSLHGSGHTPAVTARPQTAPWTLHWWHDRHEDRQALAQRLRNVHLVLIGDSLTHGWESESGYPVWEQRFAEARALNLGFSGDRTEHVLWRLRNGALNDVQACLAVVLIGTNNIGQRGDSPERVTGGIGAVVAEILERSPATHVLLLGLLPRGRTPTDLIRGRVAAVNNRLAKTAWPDSVTYVDVSADFLAPDGTLPEALAPDGLHLSRAGYEVLADALEGAMMPFQGKLRP